MSLNFDCVVADGSVYSLPDAALRTIEDDEPIDEIDLADEDIELARQIVGSKIPATTST